MRYLVMVQGSQADYDAQSGKGSADSPVWDEKAVQAMFAHMGGINDDLAESGELITGYGLKEPAAGRAVSLDGEGRPVVSDGPYSETKELLAGFWVLDCESLERVTEIAARVAP
ncbi:YciI family protein, partial [Streptomyces californicus]|uniref:YciI family protein n=1 Tax=Streptomyces californicus TaxID=67351 RepID=UPI0036C425BE